MRMKMSEIKPLAAPLFADDVSACTVTTFRRVLIPHGHWNSSEMPSISPFSIHPALNRSSDRTNFGRYFHVQNRNSARAVYTRRTIHGHSQTPRLMSILAGLAIRRREATTINRCRNYALGSRIGKRNCYDDYERANGTKSVRRIWYFKGFRVICCRFP